MSNRRHPSNLRAKQYLTPHEAGPGPKRRRKAIARRGWVAQLAAKWAKR